MQKKTLALAVLAGLTSFALTGCGGGSDDNGSNGSNGSNGNSGALTATFIDSPVAGLDVTCGTRASKTDDKGQFKFNADEICAFKLGQTELGDADMSLAGTIVTPYTITKNNKKRAIRIAALLQTLDDDADADADADNGIRLQQEKVNQLAKIDLDIAKEWNTALKDIGFTDDNIVPEADAEKHMDASIADFTGYSPAVAEIFLDINNIVTSGEWTSINFEENLARYKELINDENESSNIPTGQNDRDLVTALISIMEVTNDPWIQPTSATMSFSSKNT
ncbi:MAG: hypothetical protein ACRCYV_12015 [Aeromonas sp.]